MQVYMLHTQVHTCILRLDVLGPKMMYQWLKSLSRYAIIVKHGAKNRVKTLKVANNESRSLLICRLYSLYPHLFFPKLRDYSF